MTELRPAYAFMGNTLWQQYNKLAEELAEIRAALMEYDNNPDGAKELGALAEEIVDIQYAAETLLAILGMDAECRDTVRAVVYQKNRARGYYDFPPEC